MHENAKITATAGLAYAGAAIAALFAGDFLTLFIYWELTTFASVFLVLAGNTPARDPRRNALFADASRLRRYFIGRRDNAMARRCRLRHHGVGRNHPCRFLYPARLSALRQAFRFWAAGCKMLTPKPRPPVRLCCRPSPPSWRFICWSSALPVSNR
jgi:hypothetical protein